MPNFVIPSQVVFSGLEKGSAQANHLIAHFSQPANQGDRYYCDCLLPSSAALTGGAAFPQVTDDIAKLLAPVQPRRFKQGPDVTSMVFARDLSKAPHDKNCATKRRGFPSPGHQSVVSLSVFEDRDPAQPDPRLLSPDFTELRNRRIRFASLASRVLMAGAVGSIHADLSSPSNRIDEFFRAAVSSLESLRLPGDELFIEGAAKRGLDVILGIVEDVTTLLPDLLAGPANEVRFRIHAWGNGKFERFEASALVRRLERAFDSWKAGRKGRIAGPFIFFGIHGRERRRWRKFVVHPCALAAKRIVLCESEAEREVLTPFLLQECAILKLPRNINIGSLDPSLRACFGAEDIPVSMKPDCLLLHSDGCVEWLDVLGRKDERYMERAKETRKVGIQWATTQGRAFQQILVSRAKALDLEWGLEFAGEEDATIFAGPDELSDETLASLAPRPVRFPRKKKKNGARRAGSESNS